MIGERGGTTIDFEFAQGLVDIFKDDWKRIISEGMVEVLRVSGQFHADDLEPLGIPAEHKNVVGVVVNTKLQQRKIIEVGRRRSTRPERHGAKSGVYELTDFGRQQLAIHLGGGAGRVAPKNTDAVSGRGLHSPLPPAGPESIPGEAAAHPRGITDRPTSGTLQLFEEPSTEPDEPSYLDPDLRDAA